MLMMIFFYGRDNQFECGRECILSCGTVHSSQPANYFDCGIYFVNSINSKTTCLEKVSYSFSITLQGLHIAV